MTSATASEQLAGVAKKMTVNGSAAQGQPSPSIAPVATSKAWRRGLMVVAGLVILAGGGFLWHRHTVSAHLRARVPAQPDVSSQPALFAEALRNAGQRALSASETLGGLADLGRLYHINGYTAEAEACWSILHKEQPQEARWCYYLSDLRRSASDDVGTVAFLEQTLKLAPDYAPAWLRLAELNFKTGQLDAAEFGYRRRLMLLPGDPYASLGLARVALQRERRDEGRRIIEGIVADAPKFGPAHNLYAEMLAAEGNAEEAAKQRWLGHISGRFRDADDLWLEDLRAWCFDPSRLAVWASIDDSTNHGDLGVALLERVIKLTPNDPRGYDELGKVYFHLKNPDKARSLFEQGIKLPDASSGLYMNLSQAYRDLKDPARALEVADQGLVRFPEAAELYNARGMSLQAAGRIGEAVAAYRIAAEKDPKVCEAHFNLGNALLQLGRKEEAYASLKQALALKPTYPMALALLGQLELEAGKLDSAGQYIRPLYTYYPGTMSYRRLMTRWCLQKGMAEARAGRMAEAESALREGLSVTPDDSDILGRLGLLYAQQQRFSDAVVPLETYRRLKPTEPLAALMLGQVYRDLGRIDDARRTLKDGAQLARDAGQTAIVEQCEEKLRQFRP